MINLKLSSKPINFSPWFFSKRNYSDDLGGIFRNSTGHIIGAKTTWVQYLLEVPEDAANVAPGGIGFEFEVIGLW